MKAGKAHGFNRGMKGRRYRFSLDCRENSNGCIYNLTKSEVR